MFNRSILSVTFMVGASIIYGATSIASTVLKGSVEKEDQYKAYHSTHANRLPSNAPKSSKENAAASSGNQDGKKVVILTVTGEAAKKLDEFVNGRLACCSYVHHPEEHQFSDNVGPNISCVRTTDESDFKFQSVTCSVSFDVEGSAQIDPEYGELNPNKRAH